MLAALLHKIRESDDEINIRERGSVHLRKTQFLALMFFGLVFCCCHNKVYFPAFFLAVVVSLLS